MEETFRRLEKPNLTPFFLSSGVSNEQIGGAPTSREFGQIAATGSATLEGVYDLSLVNGFTPSPAQIFNVMSFGSESGAFSSVNLGSDLTEMLGATTLTLASSVQPSTNLAITSVTAPRTATSGHAITVGIVVNHENLQGRGSGHASPVLRLFGMVLVWLILGH